MIQDVLRKIGLTDYETRIYIALLDLGKATSGEILKKSNLNTGKIYDILNSLKNKGFISEIIESGVKKFSAANPKQIFDFLEDKKEEIKTQEKELQEIIPDILNKINSFKEEQKVEVFYGYKGLQTAHKKEVDRYSSKEVLRVLGIMGKDKYPESIYNFYRFNLYKKRKEANLEIKKILDINAKQNRDDHEKEAKIKYFPYLSPVAVVTIGNLTIIDIITQEPITITIESQKVAESFKKQFELLWQIAKE